jgi:hypothetical protein
MRIISKEVTGARPVSIAEPLSSAVRAACCDDYPGKP